MAAVPALAAVEDHPPADHNYRSADRAADDQRAPAPDTSAATRDERLQQKGLRAGRPVLIRIFKAEWEFELWMQKDDRFELFATYPICFWSGGLGPKLREGDRQAPEGFYSVEASQMRRRGRWPRSFNIGFPNQLDRARARTGSHILVHGGCTSTGCYAMTNPVMDEIYALASEALKQGQESIPVHVFPFRMTEDNMASHAQSIWLPFWQNMREGYDLFERTRLPPQVAVCGRRYVIREGAVPGTVVAAQGDTPQACEVSEAEADPTPGPHADKQTSLDRPARPHRMTRERPRAVGRNARKAYADARKARMAAHAARRTTR